MITTLPLHVSSAQSRKRSSIRGRNRCACRRRAADYVLTLRPDPRPQWNPALYDFTPADQFDIRRHRRSPSTRARRASARRWSPIGREMNKEAAADFLIPRTYYGVTAIIRFEGRRAVVAFEDPLATESVDARRAQFPAGRRLHRADRGDAREHRPESNWNSRACCDPAKYAGTARIARLQPYDPNKTVVLVIHGLMDSPATWTPMINDLRARSRRSGATTSSGSTATRAAIRIRIPPRSCGATSTPSKSDIPLRKPMVVVGHSMGGCISPAARYRQRRSALVENLW